MKELPKIPQEENRNAGILQRTPSNTNLAFASNFRLVIPKVRTSMYFCTEVTFPETTCDPVKLPIPMAPSIKFFGNQISHGDLSVKFLVNEDYSNYKQLEDWYKATLVYEDFFKTGVDGNPNLLSNVGHLLILSNKKNPIVRFRFDGLMITSLTSLDYNSGNTDTTPLSAVATFAFTTYDVDTL